jgi:hypothetical protein
MMEEQTTENAEDKPKIRLIDGKLMVKQDSKRHERKFKEIMESYARLLKGEIRCFTVFRDGPIQEKR